MIPMRRVGDQASCGDAHHSLCFLTLPAERFFPYLPTVTNSMMPSGCHGVIDRS